MKKYRIEVGYYATSYVSTEVEIEAASADAAADKTYNRACKDKLIFPEHDGEGDGEYYTEVLGQVEEEPIQ